MRSTTLVLLGVLAAAAGLWLWSRTSSGGAVVVDVLELIGGRPRGIRNNNPGNIDWIERVQARWRGMIRKETQEEGGRFAVFDTAANGVRAIARELLLDESRGIRTVAGLINNWAPASENNTSSYVQAVARELRVEPDDVLDVHGYLPRLVAAIVRHENGQQPYAAADLEQWVYS